MRPSGILLVAACVASGCGARSEMGSWEGRGGPSGGPSGGTGGDGAGAAHGGSGGQGAAAAACNNLVVRDDYRSFDVTTADARAYQPRLAATSADGKRVALVTREQPDQVPIDSSPLLTRVTFEPWDSWPAAPLGTAHLLSAGSDFVLPRRAEEGLTVWLFMSTFVTGPQMALFQAVPDQVSSPTPIVAYAGQSNVPAFVTAPLSGNSRGVGRVEQVAQAVAWLDLADEAALHPAPAPIACFLLDGVRSSAGFLFACSLSNGFHVGRFGPTTPEPVTTHEQLGLPPAQLQMVPRGDGAWVVWQEADGETSGALVAVRLDAEGKPVSDAMRLVAAGTIFDEVALAPVADDLAVAYSDRFDPGPPSILVQIFDGSGNQRAATSFTPQAWPRLAEGYGLIGAPSADALLLSWSSADPEPDVAGNARVYVARLDCAP